MVGSGRKMVLKQLPLASEVNGTGRQLQKFPKGMWTKLSRAVLEGKEREQKEL